MQAKPLHASKASREAQEFPPRQHESGAGQANTIYRVERHRDDNGKASEYEREPGADQQPARTRVHLKTG